MLVGIRKILFGHVLWALLLWVIIIPNNVHAQWFWDMVGVNGINTIWTKEKQEDALVYTIQTAINRVLRILATITLLFVLYAWFLMMTSGWDQKKYDSWLSIIKNAAIWLAIIWTSWLIVSAIFWPINGTVSPNIKQ